MTFYGASWIARLLTSGHLGGTGKLVILGGRLRLEHGKKCLQRPRAEALELLGDVMEVYRKAS